MVAPRHGRYLSHMLVVVAEKFLMAQTLAKALLRPGWQRGTDAFVGNLRGHPAALTWADGHLFELVEPRDYNPEWEHWRLQDLPVYPEQMAFRLGPRDEREVRRIERVLRAATVVVNACDAGQEGELIFDEIARMADLYRPQRKLALYRLWITDTTTAGLQQAWGELRKHDEKRLRALRERARTRAESDWLWGINLSRYCSLALRGEAGLRSSALSIGRVRTPLMAMIADRCREHALHEPEPFYQGRIVFKNEEGETCEAKLIAPPTEVYGLRDTDWGNYAEINERATHARFMRSEPWTVIEGDRQEKREYPPDLFDLTGLQRAANRIWSWGAAHTSRVAQRLYAKFEAITYPRTDATKLPETMRADALALRNVLWREWMPLRFPEVIEELPEWEPDGHHNFADRIGDHYAIIPTGKIPPMENEVGGMSEEYQLWELITLRFLGAWLPPATVLASSRAYTLPFRAGETLRALTKAAPILEPGWLLFEDATMDTRGFSRKLAERLKDEALPVMGATAALDSVEVARMKSTPPEIFTYDMLLYQMSKEGIGTPATRAETIADLLRLAYIAENGSGRLMITDEGERIVALLRAHGGEQIIDPKLSAFWETQLDRVEMQGPNGRNRRSVLDDVVVQVRDLGLRIVAPADLEEIVFCPKTGLRIESSEKGWRFAGWPEVTCPRKLWRRDMKPSEFRDILAGKKSGAGPYDFVSARTGDPYTAKIVFNAAEKKFELRFTR